MMIVGSFHGVQCHSGSPIYGLPWAEIVVSMGEMELLEETWTSMALQAGHATKTATDLGVWRSKYEQLIHIMRLSSIHSTSPTTAMVSHLNRLNAPMSLSCYSRLFLSFRLRSVLPSLVTHSVSLNMLAPSSPSVMAGRLSSGFATARPSSPLAVGCPRSPLVE